MKEIPLTQGQVALVDDEDFERVNVFKWYARYDPRKDKFYSARRARIEEVLRGSNRFIHMSRFIMSTPENMFCDHINHETLDNRKSNLRNCTASQNMMNKSAYKNNKTGFKGVCVQGKGYRVEVKVDRKIVFRKFFLDIEEAVAAYKTESKKHHGNFARAE